MRLFSKRTVRWSSLLAATAFLLVACEPEVSVDPRTDYWAGTWTCNEQTGDLAPQVYTVEVDLGADPDGVTLSGLYNQGLNFTAVGTVKKVRPVAPVNGVGALHAVQGIIAAQTIDAVVHGRSNDVVVEVVPGDIVSRGRRTDQ